ncbi:GlsB/YeaQ/YmgE family stress response membrane protein [Phreatobacter stygius]|uniref:GlsB/YeaQ/YmgE family stress response membrane protein n=1 Tax=Phreatobacter stygius TaxID=1940610 RepID=A0A4D7B3L3_9HYPH|nr:GlsB/YeaQ/YmgE family stress response membrane protein [Phreatobacter stygius]QCI65845.1 GlsB/YeaQ/YmgE family stress response membrane protein [Phreatobacter stygius]
MNETQIGWIAAIIVGGFAGWFAQMFMRANTGILGNVVLGVVGAAVASALLGLFGVSFAGTLGYLVAGFIGACILIGVGRAVRG